MMLPQRMRHKTARRSLAGDLAQKRGSRMDAGVRFEPVRIGGQYDGEDAWLGVVKSHIVMILVRVADEEIPVESQGWFMEIGFGPCRGEGRIFPTLDAAAKWIGRHIPP